MSNTYCRAAQEQLFITEKGKMQPCCYVEGPDSNNPDFVSSRLFNVKDPIDWFYNNETQQRLRDNLNSDVKDKRCSVCWKSESLNRESFRSRGNEFYKLGPSKLKILHITGGRLCNLACRMCSADLSSMIKHEQRPWLLSNNDDYNQYNWINEQEHIDKMIKLIQLEEIETLNLQGGEPQLIKGFMDMLSQVDDKKKELIDVHVTTNASVFSEPFWKEMMKFKCTTVGMSIDATGSRYGNIRYLGNWNTTKENSLKILEYMSLNYRNPGPPPQLNLNIVLQLANIDQCDSMNKFLDDLKQQFKQINFRSTLLPVEDWHSLGVFPWDPINIPVEILKGISQTTFDNDLSRQWQSSIDYAVQNNFYNDKVQEQVLKREEWFLKKYNTNLWNERPDWFEIYNRQIN